ncbi:hypothetical protein F5Y15DRAFT_419273 [Xylariaceae sp. FL0016]|nr:hypothetical protein F5Y15DRAFT_419273 [Xylariaceae sp. FL0016]
MASTDRIYEIAGEVIGTAQPPPEIPKALTDAVKDDYGLNDVVSLVARNKIDNPIPGLWAAYAILKSDKPTKLPLSDEISEDSGLSTIPEHLSTILPPICSRADLDEDATDYESLQIKGSLCLHILDSLQTLYPARLSLPPDLLTSITAYTFPSDPWSTPAAQKTAHALLSRHFHLSEDKSQAKNKAKQEDLLTPFITRTILHSFLRPLFSAARPSTITPSGRKAEFTTPSRYDAVERENPVSKPWKYNHAYAVTVFAWAVEHADPPLLSHHWPLYTPVLLTLLDEPHNPLKLRALSLLRAFWARCPANLLRDTGLAPVFEDAVFPCVLQLPGLTPEDESVVMLEAAYPALFDMAGIITGNSPDPTADSDTVTEPQRTSTGAHDRHFTDAQRKLHDKIVRDGIMVGYLHAKEHIRLVGLFCEKLRSLVQGLGILAVKYLKDFMPMISEIMTDPFGTKHPPTLLIANRFLQAILSSCWPRMPHYCNDIVKILVLCWLNINDEDSFPPGSPSPAELRSDLAKTAAMLQTIMKAANEDMGPRIDPIIEKEPGLDSLFKHKESQHEHQT